MNISIMKHFFIPFLLLIVLSSCNEKREMPLVRQGIIDLSDWDFVTNKTIVLNGEWEFYWNTFLSETQAADLPQAEWILVPNGWSSSKQTTNYPVYGYGSYRLKVKLPHKEQTYKLKISLIHSATKIWVNGKLYYTAGQIGTSRENSIPATINSFRFFSYNLESVNDELEIIVEVSNFSSGAKYAGISQKIELGESKSFLYQLAQQKLIEAIIIGFFIIISIYHFLLFFFRRNEYSTLAFAILSSVAAVRSLYTSELLSWMFNYSYELGWKLVYWPISVYPILMYLFFRFLFPREVHRVVGYIIGTISTLSFISISIFNSFIISHSDMYIGGFVLLSLIYFLLVVGFATWNKRQGAIWAFLGLLAFLAGIVNDYLSSLKIIESTFMAHYGMALYLIFQAINLADRFSFAFKQNVLLSNELNYKNKNLENIVQERTKKITLQKQDILEKNEELNVQHDILESRNTEIEQINEELNTINTSISQQNELLEMQHKSINSSIRYAKTIQQAIFPEDELLRQLFTNYFLIYLPKDIVSGDFYWLTLIPANEQFSFRTLAVVADSTGHGVPGAFMSLIGSRLLDEIVHQRNIHDPKEILNQLNIGIRSALKQNNSSNTDGMDMVICLIEKNTSEEIQVTFSGAKSPLIYFSQQTNEILRIKGSRKYLGGDKYWQKGQFEDEVIHLQVGDILYLTTDGYIDQNAVDRRRIGTPRMLKLLKEIKNERMEEQKDRLSRLLNKYLDGTSQRDDITILGIRL